MEKMYSKVGNQTVLLILFILTFFTGCQRFYVPLDSSKYESNISKLKFIKYKGTRVFLDNIENKTENTSYWHYYSSDGKIQYGVPLLTSYFWYCFRSALEDIGMTVHKIPPPHSVPHLNFILLSLTGDEFKFTVILRKNGFLVLKKQYTVETKESLTKDERTLELQAYKLIDLTLETILSDKEFQKAFFDDLKNNAEY